MKKVLLSVAVATIVAAPMAQAGSSLTGSLRYGFAYTDNGDGADAQMTLQNFGSRIKMAGDSDLGNGMTGYGNLELRLNNERDNADDATGGIGNRIYRVGLKGSFGDISFGLQDTAFDIANPDRTWWNGGAGLMGKRNEKNGALRYSKSFGDVELRAGAQMVSDADADVADIFDIGVKYAANNITLAAAIQNDAASEGTATAISGGYNFGAGDFTVTYGIEDEDFNGGVEETGLSVQVGFGDFYGWYGQTEEDTDGAATPSSIGVGYTQSLGPQTTMWYELFQNDADDDTDADMALNAVLKVDF
ncbi:MAG: porin [Granulosicoccaceae bacterium]